MEKEAQEPVEEKEKEGHRVGTEGVEATEEEDEEEGREVEQEEVAWWWEGLTTHVGGGEAGRVCVVEICVCLMVTGLGGVRVCVHVDVGREGGKATRREGGREKAVARAYSIWGGMTAWWLLLLLLWLLLPLGEGGEKWKRGS